MSTVIRAKISPEAKYYINVHRYYELKHFCLQYRDWKKIKLSATYISSASLIKVQETRLSNKTEELAIERTIYDEHIRLVEDTAKEADTVLAPYILKAVTEGLSYTYLKTVLDIPCSKGMYYDRYRKFFYLLSKERD